MLRLPDELEEFRVALRRRIDDRIEPLIAGIDASGQFSTSTVERDPRCRG